MTAAPALVGLAILVSAQFASTDAYANPSPRAEPDASRVAFESYVGVRPPGIAPVVAAVRGALERRNFVADPDKLTRMFTVHASRPGLLDPQYTSQRLIEDIDKGVDMFIGADPEKPAEYRRIVTRLSQSIANGEANPAMLAREPKNRDAMLAAYVHLSLAHDRLRNVKARDEAMLAVIRYFPERVINRNQFGPEAERIYRLNRSNVERAGRGRATITVSEREVVIYFDEIALASGKLTVGDLIPGRHRVLVAAPTGDTRQYDVDVLANEETRVHVDWAVESVLVTGEWVGFKHPTEGARTYEPELVRNLARARTNATLAVTYHVARVRDRFVLTASLYNVAQGRLVRTMRAELRSASDVAQLDRFVLAVERGGAADGVELVAEPEYVDPTPEPPQPTAPARPEPPPPMARSSTAGTRWWIPIGVTGIATIAAGGAMWGADGRCWWKLGAVDTTCKTMIESRTAAAVTLGGGIALTAFATYLYWRSSSGESQRDSQRGAAVVPTERGALATAWTRF